MSLDYSVTHVPGLYPPSNESLQLSSSVVAYIRPLRDMPVISRFLRIVITILYRDQGDVSLAEERTLDEGEAVAA
jgi:hypothetical protein